MNSKENKDLSKREERIQEVIEELKVDFKHNFGSMISTFLVYLLMFSSLIYGIASLNDDIRHCEVILDNEIIFDGSFAGFRDLLFTKASNGNLYKEQDYITGYKRYFFDKVVCKYDIKWAYNRWKGL